MPGLSWECAVLVCAIGTAAPLPDTGMYCHYPKLGGTDTLLVRHLPDGNMLFGLSTWDARGQYFGTAGTARSINPGLWRASDPETLCDIAIEQRPDGAYRVTATGARCGEGQGTPPPQVNLYPQSSRAADAPASFGVGDFEHLGCEPPRR